VSATAPPRTTTSLVARVRPRNRDLLRAVMIVIAVLGIALAAYLTYVHYSGTKPVCTAGQACVKVQTSVWSKLDGIPVALIGLIGYIGIFFSLIAPDREETRLATLGLTLIGFGFSAYLTYRELFSIHAVCEECATSAVLMTLLFVGSIARYLRGSPLDDVHSVATRSSQVGH
jgi:uncharacterized membrane protein